MPKKRSSKTATEKQENPVPEQKKPSSTPKRGSNEIDEIFAGKKRKNPEKVELPALIARGPKVKTKRPKEDETAKPKSISMNKKKKSKGAKEGGFADLPSRARKETADGFTVYTEEELGINKADAGATSLCPFDCSCCF